MNKTMYVIFTVFVGCILAFSPVLADSKCNEKAADGSSAAQACEETTEGSEGGSGQGDENGLKIGQQAESGLVDDLVQGVKDTGIQGLGKDKVATNDAIDAYVASTAQTTTATGSTSSPADPIAELPASEFVDPASVQIGWNLPNGRGTAFGHQYWLLCMQTGRGWKPWNPDVDAGKPNLERLIAILERFGTKVAPEPEGGCTSLP